jgi:hypothetical protein
MDVLEDDQSTRVSQPPGSQTILDELGTFASVGYAPDGSGVKILVSGGTAVAGVASNPRRNLLPLLLLLEPSVLDAMAAG